MKKVGLYGGTFDPPHFGHLNLAIEIMERHHLDEIWWIPVYTHPFQSKATSSTINERLEMVRLAIEEIPTFKVLDIETERVGPSYTIDTIQLLKRQFPEYQFFLLLGDDSLAHFHLWKDPEEIVRLALPLIGTRKDASIVLPDTLSSVVRQAMEKGVTPIPLMQISSTAIRQRLKEGLYCGHLVPDQVLKKRT